MTRDEAEQAWQSVLLDLKSIVDQASFATFLQNTCFDSFQDGVFIVFADRQDTCDRLNSKISDTALHYLKQTISKQKVGNFPFFDEVRFVPTASRRDEEAVSTFQIALPNNAPDAWPYVVNKLQSEMPRASFDTWVRDSRFFSFEDGVYKIAVRNAYARDWLESRLSSTVAGLLTETLNQSLEVRFIVLGDEFIPVNTEARTESEARQAEDPSSEAEPPSSVIRARVSMSEYERIVKPSRKIVFPSYFLRHVSRIGPELAWIVIGLRQLVFLNHAGKPIPGREIARWSGMSRRAFWRWSKRMDSIKEFVERRKETVDGQKVIAYTVWADDCCPLTPADARSLVTALTNLLKQHGSPEQAANALIEMTSAEIRTQILPLDPNLFEDVKGETVTVNELVQWLGWSPELGMRLEKRIIDAFGLTILTWHYVIELLPALDHGPAWMITILRDLCYDGREQRSSTLLAPTTLARMCGLQGKWINNTLSDWLRKELVQSMAADENLGDRTLGADKPHRYHVSFFDSVLAERSSRESGTTPQSSQEDASRESGTRVEGKRHKGRGQVAQPLRQSGTGVEAKWHNHRGQVAQGSRESGTTLNLFNPLNQALLNPLLTSTNQPNKFSICLDRTTSGGSVGEVASHWVLSEILQRCAVNAKKRDAILLNVTAPDFVAHLIYAHSPWGHGIENPIGWAVSQVLEPDRYSKEVRATEKKILTSDHRAKMKVRQDPQRDQYSEVFKTLACLPPGELAHLLELQYLGESLPLSPVLIDAGLNRMPPNKVRALAACLGTIEIAEPQLEGET